MRPVVACVGLGGNVGEVAQAVAGALAALDGLPQTHLIGASRIYRTPAWGRRDQPDFLNAAATLETTLPARALLDALLEIERRFGRERTADVGDRWGPRTLDLDLLLYGDAVLDEPGLRVPHPHLHERAFALLPLAEIAPQAAIPGRGSVADALAALDAGGIEAIP
ncbi:2-amino-4-hydroxy-6-hydroxymethyldihydropteridine diphosphokinase [Luteimonas viscosa]|uniref:2-amino-4-hydroxy-6-hydroxymethyldihydropteridine pyrophosphokinase n=1 Tax=Luteimonas viscosa TaxID=1132694 RepID=A0A5D4XKU2_9GAMM|nr:2-amino-4-hydroxy-6-hydroxymethyldihydropteridine diphosphokinase [Luteimonas viscosa]TYT25169.1 2-amino-4-hydroxy-6-hydroxymethyldihydropteridine diphosphokinase [Luteimonas viscosa]